MKLDELKKMNQGDEIIHKRYGLCEFREVKYSFGSLFGVVVRPLTKNGRILLACDSGTDIPDLLEGSLRKLKDIERLRNLHKRALKVTRKMLS